MLAHSKDILTNTMPVLLNDILSDIFMVYLKSKT